MGSVTGILAILARTGRGGGFIVELAGILGTDSGMAGGLDGSAGGLFIVADAGGSFANVVVS